MSDKVEIEIVGKDSASPVMESASKRVEAASKRWVASLKSVEDQTNRTVAAQTKMEAGLSRTDRTDKASAWAAAEKGHWPSGKAFAPPAASKAPSFTLSSVGQTEEQRLVAQHKAVQKEARAAKALAKAQAWAAGEAPEEGGDKGGGSGRPSGMNMATRTFALMPVVRAMLVGGPAVAALLSVLLFIQQALMIGMSGLMKMVGALAKIVGVIVKPIFDILMIALLPLLYLLMPFIKTMNLIFAPLRKRLMEKIKTQIEDIQANGGDPASIMDWGNMLALLVEAFGGIGTTIAEMIIPQPVKDWLEGVWKWFSDLTGIKTPDRSTIDLIAGVMMAIVGVLIALGLLAKTLAVFAGAVGALFAAIGTALGWIVELVVFLIDVAVMVAPYVAMIATYAASVIAGAIGAVISWLVTFVTTVGPVAAAGTIALAVGSILGLLYVFTHLSEVIVKMQELLNGARELLGMDKVPVKTVEQLWETWKSLLGVGQGGGGRGSSHAYGEDDKRLAGPNDHSPNALPATMTAILGSIESQQSAQQARYEAAMLEWTSASYAASHGGHVRPYISPQEAFTGENTGWNATPFGAEVLEDFYNKFPELRGQMDAMGPTLEMFRDVTATAKDASSTFSTTLSDGTVLVGNSLTELQAKIDAFNAQISGGGAGGAGATGGYEGYNPTGMVHIANPAGGFFGMFPAGSEFNPGTGQIDVPGAATGGYVRRTGVALIHEGENIIPAGSGGGGNVNINFSGSFADDLKRELRDFMEEYMRDQLTRRGS